MVKVNISYIATWNSADLFIIGKKSIELAKAAFIGLKIQ